MRKLVFGCPKNHFLWDNPSFRTLHAIVLLYLSTFLSFFLVAFVMLLLQLLCSHQSHGSCQQPETGCLTSFSFQDQAGCHSNSHFFCKEDSSAIEESGNKVSFVSWLILIEAACRTK
jgi:hypothetical protein